MSTTTFKNVAYKRKYRERSQVSGREHLGILEKKKDYVQRAKHYHKQEDKLNKLKVKAALKNPDEFFHKMKSGKQIDGQFHYDDSEDEGFDVKEYKKILKTQSQNQVKLQKYIDQKSLKSMQSQNQLIDAPKINKHTIFLDDQSQYKEFDLANYYDTIPEMLQQKHNVLKKSQLEDQIIDSEDEQLVKDASSKIKQNYKKLAEKTLNEKKMEKMMLKLDYSKNLLGKEKMKLKKYKTGKIHKFFKERKK